MINLVTHPLLALKCVKEMVKFLAISEKYDTKHFMSDGTAVVLQFVKRILPVSYTHLDVYKRQGPEYSRELDL